MKPFLFTIPAISTQTSEAARDAIQLSALASRLVSIERTRCAHPDGRAENDAEHGFMLGKVAPELAHRLHPSLDENLVARFALLHDDVEAYVGDTPTDILANHDPSAKNKHEQAGLERLVQEYAHMPRYVELIRQYESQQVAEARFVRATDKLMVLLIHFADKGETLRKLYSRETFLRSENRLMERDGYKYAEFDSIKELRHELGVTLADMYLE